MQNLRSRERRALASSRYTVFDAPAGPTVVAGEAVAAPAPVVELRALGELLALLLGLAGLALLGSELAGVGWSRSADRLALLMPPPFASD